MITLTRQQRRRQVAAFNNSFLFGPMKSALSLFLLLAISLLGQSRTFAANLFVSKWENVDPAILAAKDSTRFPGTDAEILFSKHDFIESGEYRDINGSEHEHMLAVENYVRAKIYTTKGVQDQGKLRVRNTEDSVIEHTDARVVKTDGRIISLKKEDIVTTLLAKDKDGVVWKETNFVFPNLEPGDVVEYRWDEMVSDEVWLRLWYTQAAVPTCEYTFRVSKMDRAGVISWMNCPKVTTDDKHGFLLTVRDQPAFEEESHMPPEKAHRGFLYIVKRFPQCSGDEEVWKLLSKYWADEFDDATKPSSAIKKKAQALAEGATTDEAKLQSLYKFCQESLFNTSFKVNDALRKEIDKHKDDLEPDSPAKILGNGHGRSDEINNLFASLARALGYKVKLVRSASRSEIIDIRIVGGWAFLGRSSIAVQCSDGWHFLNPGDYLVPYGMMDWKDQQQPALLCSDEKVELTALPGAAADSSQVQRKARLALDADGNLEGQVEENFTGLCASAFKGDTWADSEETITKNFRDEITKRVPSAEISDIAWTNLASCGVPLTVKYHVRVPAYAQQAGKRLLFAPAYFQAGLPVLFSAAERRYPIFFRYAWSEHDDVEIVLPEGYTLDKPSAPANVGSIESGLGAVYMLKYNPKTRTFGYKRDFALGANGGYSFQPAAYPALKTRFEALQRSDSHTIVLKPKAAPAPEPAAAPAEPAAQPTEPNSPQK